MRMLQEIRKPEFFAPPRDHDSHHDQQQDPLSHASQSRRALGAAFFTMV
jgi:hypothetical protein